jgi:hypothetical protein
MAPDLRDTLYVIRYLFFLFIGFYSPGLDLHLLLFFGSLIYLDIW